jgi:hypothetical protein
MDFSLHEQRRLAQIERDLSADRRLAALMSVLAADRARRLRRLRCFAARVRHPWYGRVGRESHRLARVTLALALVVTLLAPPALIASVIAGISALAIAATAAIPVAVVLLVISYRRTRRQLNDRL